MDKAQDDGAGDGTDKSTAKSNLPAWPEESAEARVGTVRNTMPIAALVLGALGVVAILLFKSPIAIVLGVLGVVFGFLGLRQVNRGIADRRGFARAGLILGLASIVLSVVILVLYFRAYDNCKDKIGHAPNQNEFSVCVKKK